MASRARHIALCLLVCAAGDLAAQTLTFTLKRGTIPVGLRTRYEVWVRSSSGTARMGSLLVYTDYNASATGGKVASAGAVSVQKNSAAFGSGYAPNPVNDNTLTRFAHSWTYTGAPGAGTVVPSTGDGVLAFTVELTVFGPAATLNLALDSARMAAEQYIDSETAAWPVISVGSGLPSPAPVVLPWLVANRVLPGKTVRVQWSTAAEFQNQSFEVQKSVDSTTGFATLPGGTVAGHGTSSSPWSYIFTDTAGGTGRLYYRLKQNVVGGEVNYSDAVPTGVTGVEDRAMPTAFALDQNYPNPFNPATTIDFALPVQARVRLEVFNALGQEVATLVDETRQAGYHSVRFDASRLSSGLYLYRLRAGDVSFLRKMVLVR